MNIDGQGSNHESQSYDHNDDILIQGSLSPNDSGNNVRNIHHNKANISSSNDHHLSEKDIEEDLFESDRIEEYNEPQTKEEQSSYEDSERCRCR